MLKFLHSRLNASVEKIAISSIMALIFNSAILYLVTMFWAKWLGADGYGIYAHMWSSILIASSIASFGVPLLVQRDIPRKDAGERKKLISSILVVLPLLLVITCALILAINFFNTNIIYDLNHGLILFLGSFLYLTFNILEAILKGLSLYSEVNYLKKILFPGALLAGSLGYGLIFESTSFEDYIYVRVLCMTIIVYWMLTQHKEELVVDFNIKKIEVFSLLTQSRNFFVGSSVILLGSELSIFFAGFYLESSALGAYSLGVRIATVVNMALIGANVPAMQCISSFADQGNIDGIEKMAKKTAKLALIGATVLYGIVLCSVDFLLYMFDLSFDNQIVRYTVAWVGGAYLISAFLGPSGVVLNMSGKEPYANFSAILALVVMGSVMFFLSDQFGYWSVVLGFSLNILVWKVSMTVLVRRLYKFWTVAI